MTSAWLALSLCAAGGPATDSLDAWLARWAESVEFERLSAEFTAVREVEGVAVETVSGSWALRLKPTFAQYVSYRRFAGERLAGECSMSWDSARGEGREYHRKPGVLRGVGTRSLDPPRLMGRAELPTSEYFYVEASRSVGRGFQVWPPRFQPLDPKGTRFAALVAKGASRLVAYVFDRSLDQPLVEKRTYTVKPPPAVIENTTLGEPIDLPDPFAAAVLFVNKVVTGSEEAGCRRFPVRWEVRPCLGPKGGVFKVELRDLEVDGEEPEHGYSVTWPPGTGVLDAATLEEYSVGDAGERVEADLVTEADLDRMLEDAGFQASGAGSSRRHSAVVTGCGANALYLALAMTGRPRPLEDIASALGLAPGRATSSAAQLVNYVRQAGGDTLAVEGGPELLETAAGVARAVRDAASGRRLLLWLAVAVALSGCSDEPAGSCVAVVGPSSVDLGRIPKGGKNRTWRFRLRNETPRAVAIRELRRSCNCLDHEIAATTMGPGAETDVTLVLDTTMIAGRRDARALVMFDDPEVEPVTLRLAATVVAPYTVTVDPHRLAVPPADSRARPVVRTFTVTEFLPEEVPGDAVTRITPESAGARVLRVDPWEVRGWRVLGFARRTRLTLELRFPEEENTVEVRTTMRFDHVPREQDAPALSASAELVLQRQ